MALRKSSKDDEHKGKYQVFTTRITLKNGRILNASDVGKKVFVFWTSTPPGSKPQENN